jgi:menaquinone-dependent protoporphyrinogen oxidase
MSKPVSRRDFLKTGCLVTTGAVIALAGGTAVAATYQPEINLPETSYGDASAKKRILIAYATKAGSTAESAARMAFTLSNKGYLVDIMPIGKVTSLDAYQAVVLGSAIRMGSVLPAVRTFIEKNQAALNKIPMSFFILCLTMATDDEANRIEASAYLEPVRAIVKPASEGLFAGALVPEKLKLLDRLIAVTIIKSPVGDFRNWDQINAWAENIPTA